MEPHPVFALLDDRDATSERPTSRLYTGYSHERRCTDPSTLDAAWQAVEADQRNLGLHALVLVDYEWGAKLLQAGHAALTGSDASALRVLLFRDCRRLDRQAVGAWLAEREGGAPTPGVAGAMDLVPSVDAPAFTDAIGRIHEAIRAGETYQVNYTYRLHGAAHGSPVALYRRLRQRQPVEFGAFIALPGDDDAPSSGQRHILSCSPELFLRHAGGVLTARPMKGTASRTLAPEGDSETARLLSLDIKNRAENLMIVDLLRNDLGRIARTGSVRVPALFAIEPYSTVFQMTSTIEAQLAPGNGFADVLRATFPCGSITGAPKHHTMHLIAGLESTPRGIYCGGIGWVDAPPADDATGRRCGDFCLSVGIRTLTLGPEAGGVRPARLGIGAGIVLDSVAEDEFEECRLKGRFLTRLDPGFALFETMPWRPGEGVPHLELHLARLAASAAVFGFAYERDLALAAVQHAVSGHQGDCRVRLALSVDGRVDAACVPLAPLVTLAPPVTATAAVAPLRPAGPAAMVGLLIADQRLPNADPLSAHKTTRRAAYDAGVAAAERVGAFDSLWFTADGRLAEGGRSNVFLRLDGQWCTPPVADGALPGIARGRLLADAAFGAVERRLRLPDLQRAEAIVVCNALRGRLDARLTG